MLLDIAGNARLDVDEGVAAVMNGLLHQIAGPADGVAIVPVACRQLQAGPQILVAQITQLGIDRDLADFVTGALIDRERQEKPLPVGRKFGAGIGNLDVCVAVLQVEPAQQFLVVSQPLRIVLVRRRQEAPPAGLRGC